jgi:beta-lactam-binding protein with PASTA domain
MVQFATVLLRGVIATFVGLLIAGGTLTFAADRATVQEPTLVAVSPGPTTLTVPNVTGQAYVFAKGILQDHGFAWHVTGPVFGYAANTVDWQSPAAGTIVLDTGAPMVTVTLGRNQAYIEKGTPENDAPYSGTTVRLPANVRQPVQPSPPAPLRSRAATRARGG